jgi:hypothetical protein
MAPVTVSREDITRRLEVGVAGCLSTYGQFVIEIKKTVLS